MTEQSVVEKIFGEDLSPQDVERQGLEEPDGSRPVEGNEETKQDSNRHSVDRVPGGGHHGGCDGVGTHERVDELPHVVVLNFVTIQRVVNEA